MKNLEIIFNTISKQDKGLTSKITPSEWNFIVNVLSKQSNHNAEILKNLKIVIGKIIEADEIRDEQIDELKKELTVVMNQANNLENANMFKDVNYNNLNGVLTFTKYDDTTEEIDLRQSIVKVNQTTLTEVDLVYFMQTLEDGMYRIKTELWGHEFLFVSDMNLPVDPDAEEEVLELKKEYARYTSNGTSYRYAFELNDWVLSAGGGGGAGGGGSVTTIQLTPVPLNFPLNFGHAIGTDLSVTVNFTHSELEFATLRILRGSSEVEVRGVNLGENVIDLTPHIRAGSNSITLRVTDGERSRSISYNITGVTISLSSTFNDAVIYGSSVDIPFRVQTEAQRKVYFTINGVTETLTNVQLNNIKSLTGLTHGVKEVEIQAAAIIGQSEVLSNKIKFNIIVSTQNSPALISSKFEIAEATRGSLISVDYIVYNPMLEFNATTLKVDGVTVGTLTADRQRQFWNVRNLAVGLRTLRIESAGVYKEFEINILPLDIGFGNIEDSFLKLYLTSAGKSNNDVDKLKWENSFGSPLTTNLSNFNFASNGWIDDSLVLNGNATISIPFKPFENVVPQVGKTIELEFETTEGLSDEFIRCMHNNRGFIIYKDRALLRSSNTQVEVFYKENEKIKISFVINPVAGYTLTYVNGVMTGIDRMNTQTSFQQSTAQNIIVNDKAVDGKLYNVRVYDRALEHQEILQNYLYDIVSIEDKIVEYNFSDIFNQSGSPDIEKVKQRIPVLTIRTYTSDEFGNRLPQTDNFRPYVSAYYEHHTNPDKNFSLPNVRIRTQGASTLQYPVKNFRLYQGDLDLNPIAFNDEMHPAIRINLKADYMESSMSTDPAFTSIINTIYNKPIPPKAVDDKSRTTIWSEGAIALFHDDGQNVRFEGIYNFNGDKGDNKQWGFYPELPFPESDMRRFEVLFNAANHAVAFVKNPLLTEEEWLNQLYEGFEPRYPYDSEGDEIYTPEQYEQLSDFIEFISDADLDTPEGIVAFKAEFEQRAEVEYFTKFLLSLFIFGLIDNFGKDLLLQTWGNEGGLYPKWYVVLYDMDSGVGIDNQGFMTDSDGNLLFDYNIEMEDSGVFAQASSRLWDAVVIAYADTLKSTYAELRGSVYTWENIWKYLYTDQIAKISKGMYNANAIAKYIETPGSEAWLWMLNGDRVNQMSRWLKNRLAYLDSKYDYNTDEKRISARFDIDDTENFYVQVKTTIHQWVSAELGNSSAGIMKTRTLLGEVATLNHSYTNGTELPFVEFNLFNGHYITELVNMKDLPVRTLQVAEAEQLKVLDLSKETPNSQLQSVSFGDNFELTEVNLQNNSGLGGLLDLSGAIKLKKLDLRGTAVTSVILPVGGVLEELHLPNTITALEIRNQSYLTQIDMAEGTELEILIFENTPIDYRDLLPYLSAEDGKVRILGIEMSAYGEDYLLSIQTDLIGIGGIDSNGNYTDKPFMQGIVKVQSNAYLDPDLLNWFAVNLADLTLEVNVLLNGLQFTEHEDHFAIRAYTQDTTGLIALPTGINTDLSPANNTVVGIDGWKPVTKIDDGVFINKRFTSIQLPNKLEEIGASAFQGADQFVEIYIPETVTTIGANAFSSCSKLISITILEGVTTIGANAFEGTTSLENIILPSTLTTLGKEAFKNSGLTMFEVPPLITILREGMFNGASNLLNIDLNNVKEIETYVFKDVSSLENLFILSTVETMAENVLWNVNEEATILTTYESRPLGWHENWNGNFTGTLLYGVSNREVTFNYDSKGGSNVGPVRKRVLITPRITSKFGHDFLGWEYNGNMIELPFIPEENDPDVINLEAVWSIWTFEVRFVLPDDSVHYTIYNIDNGTAIGSEINSIPTPEYGEFKFYNWIYDQNILNENAIISQDKNLYGEIVFIEAQFLDMRGLVFTYNATDDVYDVTDFSLTDTSMANGSINLFVPATYDNGINGEKYVRNVRLNASVLAHKQKIGSIVIEENILTNRTIPNTGLNGCRSLTEVVIPDGFISIGSSAFSSCEALTSIAIPETVTTIGATAFGQCSSLTSITIPEGVTSIEASTFSSCSALTSITIPEGVTNIKDYAFSNCLSLTSITIPEGVISIGSQAFSTCSTLTSVTLPESLTSIGSYAISRCPLLTSITIPANVASIGSNAFLNCTSLTSVTLLRNYLTLAMFSNNQFSETQAVFNITSLQDVIILTADNRGVMNLAQTSLILYPSASGAFNWDSIIPSSVTSIGNSAFNGSLLTSITIPSSVTSIGNSAFKSCKALTSITILEGVTTIGANAFDGCSALTSITIPTSVTSIEAGTFMSCSKLISVTIPETVTTIGATAFFNSSSLTSITIPSSVTSIGNQAFSNCSKLISVNLLRTTPPTLSNTNAFSSNASGRTFYIPENTYTAYSTATNWSTYASRMEEVI